MPDVARRTPTQEGRARAIAAFGRGRTVPHVAKVTAEQASLVETMARADEGAMARADELRGEQGRLLETLHGELPEQQAAAIWRFLEDMADREDRDVWLLVLADLVDRTRDNAPLRDLLSAPHTYRPTFGAPIKAQRLRELWRLLTRVRTHWRVQRQRQAFLDAYCVPLTPEQHAELRADRALTNAAARVLLKRGAEMEQRYSRAAEQ